MAVRRAGGASTGSGAGGGGRRSPGLGRDAVRLGFGGRKGTRRGTPLFARMALAARGLVLLPAFVSCGEPPDPLLGAWVSVAAETGQTTYVFEEDGRARWVVQLAEGPDTFAVAYRVDYSQSPIHLDVGPWPAGPLAGRTLFGIVEMQGPDRFVVDFEPADPDGDATTRPSRLSNQAVTFVRRLN